MAVDLSLAKGSIKNTADELVITSQILTRWPKEHSPPPPANFGGRTGISQEQQEILRLRKELKQAELERIDFYDSCNSGWIKIFIFFFPLLHES